MALFLAHFCVGVVLARAGFGPSFRFLGVFQFTCMVCGLFALLAEARFKNTIRILFLSFAGLLWGASHGGNTTVSVPIDGTVVKVAATSAQPGPLLVASSDGVVYETFGSQKRGVIGELKNVSRESIFGSARVKFKPRYIPSSLVASWWERWQAALREWTFKATRHLDPKDRQLIGGIILGAQGSLPTKIQEAFKQTGLYHLLVVSGLHVSLMAALFSALLRAPLQCAYAFCLISPLLWRQLSALLQITAAVGALAYLSLTGASAAAQRSALFFFTRRVSLVFMGDIPFATQLLMTGFLQVIFFPLGFLSEGTCMSWCAYLVVAHPRTSLRDGAISRFWWALIVQGELTILVTAVFGQLVLMGLLTNLVFVSVFSVVVVVCLLVLVLPPGKISDLALDFSHNYIELVQYFDHLIRVWPGLSIPRDHLPVWVRMVAISMSVVIVLNGFRRMTISKSGGLHYARQALDRTKNSHH